MSDSVDLPAGLETPAHRSLSRRSVMSVLAGIGVGTATWQRALAAQVEETGTITPEMIQQAEWIAGLELSKEDREETARSIRRALDRFDALRSVEVGYDVPPAVTFSTAPWRQSAEPTRRNQAKPIECAAPRRPDDDETLAFLPVTELSALLRSGEVSSRELTELYLGRLKRYNPLLNCVVTYTEELAFEQARRADEEIAAGRYRGPLHGIPWGAKDLIAWPGYPTTWGAPHFREQMLEDKATVARRLEDVGAVMVAKLSLGALAMGDKWFNGRTNNPWDPRQGSSGSSAGSASAVSAGLVGFALGSETLGSIVSPCRRCGSTGLRPTFGRVSRHGCMALSWSMDKIGPITRSVEDCALILDAIHGSDGQDHTVVDQPFHWPPRRPLSSLRVGCIESNEPEEERDELTLLRELGVQLIPIELPHSLPASAVSLMLGTEAATVFDELTRRGITEGLNSWPSTFRRGQFVPAVEYLRASRVRTLLMREMDEVMREVDLYVGGRDLVITNLTGHPTAVFPAGFVDRDGRSVPFSVTMTGQLFGESDLLSVAHAFQRARGMHLKRPPLDEFLKAAEQEAAEEKAAKEKAAKEKPTDTPDSNRQ